MLKARFNIIILVAFACTLPNMTYTIGIKYDFGVYSPMTRSVLATMQWENTIVIIICGGVGGIMKHPFVSF